MTVSVRSRVITSSPFASTLVGDLRSKSRPPQFIMASPMAVPSISNAVGTTHGTQEVARTASSTQTMKVCQPLEINGRFTNPHAPHRGNLTTRYKLWTMPCSSPRRHWNAPLPLKSRGPYIPRWRNMGSCPRSPSRQSARPILFATTLQQSFAFFIQTRPF